MSKKKILTLGLVVLSGISLLAFTSCKKNAPQTESEVESQVQTIESTSGIEYELSDDGSYYVISNYNGTAKKVVCGDSYKNLPIKEIANNAFYNSTIESLTIADSIEKIGEYAFFNCDELTSINFGSGLKEIGEYSFSACKNLTQVSLPEGLERIESHAFYSSFVINVSIPNSIEFIGLDAFTSCNELQFSRYDNAYYLGNTDNKFVALVDIAETDEPSTQKSYSVHVDARIIASGAFENHQSLEKITIAQNLTAIGDLAFAGCSKLNSVILPKTVKSIGVSAFAYCSSLRNVNLPENLVVLGDGAFNQCSKLSVIYIPDNVVEIAPFTFNGCSSLSQASIGTSVKSIGAYAFNDCSSLSFVSFKNYYGASIESIEEFAFNGCYGLSTFMLPSSIKEIGENALVDTLRTIYAFHTKSQWIENGFDNNPTLTPFSSVTYLYSENRPELNENQNDYDRKYFFVSKNGNITVWQYVVEIGGISCTYSKTEPSLNSTQTDYVGNYFYYDDNGTPRKWIYEQD